MNGVTSAWVSGGSNQIGARETCTPQMSCPAGAAARAKPGAPAARPSAPSASRSRRVIPEKAGLSAGCASEREDEFIDASVISSPPCLGAFFATLEQAPDDCLSRLAARPRIGRALALLLSVLERYVLIRAGIGEHRDQPETGLADFGPHT